MLEPFQSRKIAYSSSFQAVRLTAPDMQPNQCLQCKQSHPIDIQSGSHQARQLPRPTPHLFPLLLYTSYSFGECNLPPTAHVNARSCCRCPTVAASLRHSASRRDRVVQRQKPPNCQVNACRRILDDMQRDPHKLTSRPYVALRASRFLAYSTRSPSRQFPTECSLETLGSGQLDIFSLPLALLVSRSSQPVCRPSRARSFLLGTLKSARSRRAF